ncbi:hypothetical protein SK128_024734, partial [Halocaridina rubra]
VIGGYRDVAASAPAHYSYCVREVVTARAPASYFYIVCSTVLSEKKKDFVVLKVVLERSYASVTATRISESQTARNATWWLWWSWDATDGKRSRTSRSPYTANGWIKY